MKSIWEVYMFSNPNIKVLFVYGNSNIEKKEYDFLSGVEQKMKLYEIYEKYKEFVLYKLTNNSVLYKLFAIVNEPLNVVEVFCKAVFAKLYADCILPSVADIAVF